MTMNLINELIAEYTEAESVEEVLFNTESNTERGLMCPELEAAHAAAMQRLSPAQVETLEHAEEVVMEQSDATQKIAALEAMIKDLQARLGSESPVKPSIQVTKPSPKVRARNARYRLVKKDVSWASQPQVHALMAIIGAHVGEGQVVLESDIVRMVQANKQVLNTVQPAERIWDYYKGGHERGLLAHGNLEVVK